MTKIIKDFLVSDSIRSNEVELDENEETTEKDEIGSVVCLRLYDGKETKIGLINSCTRITQKLRDGGAQHVQINCLMQTSDFIKLLNYEYSSILSFTFATGETESRNHNGHLKKLSLIKSHGKSVLCDLEFDCN